MSGQWRPPLPSYQNFIVRLRNIKDGNLSKVTITLQMHYKGITLQEKKFFCRIMLRVEFLVYPGGAMKNEKTNIYYSYY